MDRPAYPPGTAASAWKGEADRVPAVPEAQHTAETDTPRLTPKAAFVSPEEGAAADNSHPVSLFSASGFTRTPKVRRPPSEDRHLFYQRLSS